MSATYSLDGVRVETVPVDLALRPFGVFTTFVVVDGGVVGWAAHLERLRSDARSLWGHELDVVRLTELVGAHLANVPGPATVRVTLYPEQLDVARPSEAAGCRVLVSTRPARFPFRPERGLRVATLEYRRDLASIKSIAVLGQLDARRSVQLRGFDDVLFRVGEQLLEGATWSVVAWFADEVVTPGEDVLPSVTTSALGRIADDLGRQLVRRRLERTELADAELVLAVNVNQPARALESVDGAALQVDEALLAQVADRYSALERDPVV